MEKSVGERELVRIGRVDNKVGRESEGREGEGGRWRKMKRIESLEMGL